MLTETVPVTVGRPNVIRRLLRRWMTRRVDWWTPQTVKKTAVLQLLYLSGVLKKGRLSSDDGCCKASGLAQCLRASVGKTRFRILLNCLRLAVKESINERTGGGVTNTDNCCYCTVLYCTVLHCTVLYCTVLYCTVLYCTVLYCTVLYCTVPCGNI